MARITGRAKSRGRRSAVAQEGRSRRKTGGRAGRSRSTLGRSASAPASRSRRRSSTTAQARGAARKRATRLAGRSRNVRTTTDHDEIRRWAEARSAQPACVRATGGGKDVGMVRLDFPGYSGRESLEPISWDDWFRKFDESDLALIYEETTARGEPSNFNKLIGRETAEKRQRGKVRASRRHPKRSAASGRSQKRQPAKAAKSSRRSEPGSRTSRKKAA